MEKKTKGAWLINHTKRLSELQGVHEFEDIELAGKCGIFLSNLAASNEESDINSDKVNAIARVSNVKKTEIDTIKRKLVEAQLIDVSANGAISVIGITTSSVLGHTNDIFSNSNPSNYQQAALDLSDSISDLPKPQDFLTEYISDNHKLSTKETQNLIRDASEIGFVDHEKLDDGSNIFFNGNLFKRDNLTKTNAVLSSLKPSEVAHIIELDELLKTTGCITVIKAEEILGKELLPKLQAIGMYDFNEVSNSKETVTFLTKPAAFAKYGNPFEEDALDLAKAFVAALYYGINFSPSNRGKINMLKLLMRKLVNGNEVGPATAIGQDYKILELRRVIQIRRDITFPNRYHMKLLKKDIGELALQVLETGDATEQTVMNAVITPSDVTSYVGPEENRVFNRKRQSEQAKEKIAEIIRTFRS